jgi:hypothetical protein
MGGRAPPGAGEELARQPEFAYLAKTHSGAGPLLAGANYTTLEEIEQEQKANVRETQAGVEARGEEMTPDHVFQARLEVLVQFAESAQQSGPFVQPSAVNPDMVVSRWNPNMHRPTQVTTDPNKDHTGAISAGAMPRVPFESSGLPRMIEIDPSQVEDPDLGPLDSLEKAHIFLAHGSDIDFDEVLTHEAAEAVAWEIAQARENGAEVEQELLVACNQRNQGPDGSTSNGQAFGDRHKTRLEELGQPPVTVYAASQSGEIGISTSGRVTQNGKPAVFRPVDAPPEAPQDSPPSGDTTPSPD